MGGLLIYYYLISTFVSIGIFILTKDEKYMYYYCPKWIYKNTKCNIFGVLLIFLLLFILAPVYYLLWFIYWLCHVGRK